MKGSTRRQRRDRLRNHKLGTLLKEHPIPWPWMLLTVIAYAAIGLCLAVFPAPYWIWPVAIVGVLVQAIAIAGPQSLSRFRWLGANLIALLNILGSGAIAATLAIALNYIGTDQLDDIVPQDTAIEVFLLCLLAVLIAGVSAIVGAATGDRLLNSFRQFQASLILAALCILGLGLGSLLGLAIIPPA